MKFLKFIGLVIAMMAFAIVSVLFFGLAIAWGLNMILNSGLGVSIPFNNLMDIAFGSLVILFIVKNAISFTVEKK